MGTPLRRVQPGQDGLWQKQVGKVAHEGVHTPTR